MGHRDKPPTITLTSYSQYKYVEFVPGDSGSKDIIKVNASDGTSKHGGITFTFVTNTPPTISVRDGTVDAGKAVSIDDFVSIGDVDGDDTIEQIKIHDMISGGGYLYYNGDKYDGENDYIVLYDIDDFDDVVYIADTKSEVSTIKIGVYDGEQWQLGGSTDPTTFEITTVAEGDSLTEDVDFGTAVDFMLTTIAYGKQLLAETTNYTDGIENLKTWAEVLGTVGDTIGVLADLQERIERIEDAETEDKERQAFIEIFELSISVAMMFTPMGLGAKATTTALRTVAWYFADVATDYVYDTMSSTIRDIGGYLYDMELADAAVITSSDFTVADISSPTNIMYWVVQAANELFDFDVIFSEDDTTSTSSTSLDTSAYVITADFEATDEADDIDVSVGVSGSYMAMADGGDNIRLSDYGNTVSVSSAETVTGGSGLDVIQVMDVGSTIMVGMIETLNGGSGGDWITLDDSGNTIVVTAVETILGGAGVDTVVLDAASTIIMAAVEMLVGSSGVDVVMTGARGGTLVISNIETISGGSGADWITLNSANAINLSGVETVLGSVGSDIVTFGGSGTVIIAAIETLIGGSGADVVTTGARGGTVVISNVETVVGGAGADWITLNSAGAVNLSGIETVLGSSGADAVTLGASGTMIMAAVETLTGGVGGDWITLGNRGGTVYLSGIETLLGGTGDDYVRLSDTSNAIITAAIETLVGGTGSDSVALGARGVTLSISGVETIKGGDGNDAITLSNSTAETVVFSGYSGFDRIYGFSSATDKLAIAGNLLSALDDDLNASVSAASRAQSGVNVSTDEVVVLSTTISSLEDSGYSAFRSALGNLTGSSVGAEVLVIANTGTDTGVYLVTDSDGNGTVSSDEANLLAVVHASSVTWVIIAT